MNKLTTRSFTHDFQHYTFREYGWINMTEAAKHFGKETKYFLRLPSTIEYLEALRNTGESHLLEITRGRSGGTWGHPRLAVVFARWLDMRFAVFCDAVISDLINGHAEMTMTKPEESAAMALPQTYAETLRALIAAEEAREAQTIECQEVLQMT